MQKLCFVYITNTSNHMTSISFLFWFSIYCLHIAKKESINISSLKVGKCNGTECREKKGYVSWCIRNRHKIIMGVEKGFLMTIHLHIVTIVFIFAYL